MSDSSLQKGLSEYLIIVNVNWWDYGFTCSVIDVRDNIVCVSNEEASDSDLQLLILILGPINLQCHTITLFVAAIDMLQQKLD